MLGLLLSGTDYQKVIVAIDVQGEVVVVSTFTFQFGTSLDGYYTDCHASITFLAIPSWSCLCSVRFWLLHVSAYVDLWLTPSYLFLFLIAKMHAA